MAVVPLGEIVGDADEIYASFEEAPLDELPAGYKDGDDSLVKDGPVKDAPILAPKPRPRRRVVVPHPRDLRMGNTGSDVTALQRALAAAHLRKWGTFTTTYGLGTKKQVAQFQKTHGVKASGVYNKATHLKLARFYDPHGIWLINQYIVKSALDQHRARLLTAAHIAYNYGGRIHYTQGGSRMMMVTNHIHHETLPHWNALYADCSAFATWLYWDAGVADPNGLGYNGYGFTGTLAQHGRLIPSAQASVGDLFLYGYRPTFEHVTICVGKNRCISQGTEYGPNLLNPFYRSLSECRHYPGF